MPPIRSDRRSKRIQKRTQSQVDNRNVNSQESHSDIDTPNNVDSNIWTVVGRLTNSLTAVQQQLSTLQHQQVQNTTIQQTDVSQTLNDAQNLNIEGIQDSSGNCRTQLGTDLNSSGTAWQDSLFNINVNSNAQIPNVQLQNEVNVHEYAEQFRVKFVRYSKEKNLG